LSDIDPAIIRPGRIDVHIHLALPNASNRQTILQKTLKGMPNRLSTEDISLLVEKTENLPSGEIVDLCREAAMNCIRSANSEIELTHFVLQ
jgi:ATP-dependent 26S proteasome regulatory subunit